MLTLCWRLLVSTDLDIVPGDHLIVYQQPDVDEDEQEQLVLAGGNRKTPRRSQNESGSGFGGTALSSGIYRTADKNVDSFVKMISPSDHQSDDRSSSPPTIPRLQLNPKKDRIDLSDNDLPSEVVPRISKKRAARTAEEIQQALEDGKNVTEEEMDILLGGQDEPRVPNTCPKCSESLRSQCPPRLLTAADRAVSFAAHSVGQRSVGSPCALPRRTED